jgi:hypothetical protein
MDERQKRILIGVRCRRGKFTNGLIQSSTPVVVRMYCLAQGATFDNFRAVVEGSIVPNTVASQLAKVPE